MNSDFVAYEFASTISAYMRMYVCITNRICLKYLHTLETPLDKYTCIYEYKRINIKPIQVSI